jgi:hypothetical protein
VKVTITTGDNFRSDFQSLAVSSFLSSFDPLTHYHQLIDWHSGTTTLRTLKVELNAAASPPFALSANHLTANATLYTDSVPGGSTLSFPWKPTSNFPFMLTTKLFEEIKRHEKEAHHIMFDRPAFAVFSLPNILDTTNHNLNTPQKELLLWHQR